MRNTVQLSVPIGSLKSTVIDSSALAGAERRYQLTKRLAKRRYNGKEELP
jgi:hypothetical protein